MKSQERLRWLETLAEELLKDNPEDQTIREGFQAVGLVDNLDPVDRMNKVLHALSFQVEDKEFQE
jgi:hypothetical protein